MSPPHPGFVHLHRIRLRLLAIGRHLWRMLSQPRVALVMDPSRLAESATGRPIVLIPGRIVVMHRVAPGDRH